MTDRVRTRLAEMSVGWPAWAMRWKDGCVLYDEACIYIPAVNCVWGHVAAAYVSFACWDLPVQFSEPTVMMGGPGDNISKDNWERGLGRKNVESGQNSNPYVAYVSQFCCTQLSHPDDNYESHKCQSCYLSWRNFALLTGTLSFYMTQIAKWHTLNRCKANRGDT